MVKYFGLIKEAWNALELKQQLKDISLKSGRGKKVQQLICEYGIDSILQAIKNAGESDFLKGKGPNGWEMDFDWFIEPDHFVRVLENSYKTLWKDETVKSIPENNSGHTAELRQAKFLEDMKNL